MHKIPEILVAQKNLKPESWLNNVGFTCNILCVWVQCLQAVYMPNQGE